MRKFGLIGHPLTHSFSPEYFNTKFEKESIFDAEYRAYDISDIQEIITLLDNGVSGLNVTIPYKESVIPYLDKIDALSAMVMAVNTVVVRNGKRIGYNTDLEAFRLCISKLIEGSQVEKALILGTGGSSKTVEYVLRQLGIVCRKVSRTRADLLYIDLNNEIISEHQLIVNTTPLGMYPEIEDCPGIPYEYITENHFVMDLIYNPEKTLFLKRAQQNGAAIMNGKEMLLIQAENSWNLWNQ